MKTLLTIPFLLCLPLAALSQAPANEDPAHEELRALRDGLIEAIQAGDITRELTYLHPNVVVTWQNAEVSRGRDGVREYLERMLEGPSPIVENYSADFNVDALTILYGGDAGISFGSSQEHVDLIGGESVDYTGRWSATLVREGGQWLIASLHGSANLFDNPFLATARRLMYVVGIVALAVGLVVGFLVGRGRKAAA
jgi:ketosteroid isomerase-like protein